MKKPPALTEKNKLFVMHMTSPGRQTFNNATQSYIAVFKPNIDELSRKGKWTGSRSGEDDDRIPEIFEDVEDTEVPSKRKKDRKKYIQSPYEKAYEVCKTMGGRLFSKAHVRDAIDKRLLKIFGDNEMLDLRHAQLLFQDEDRNVSLSALRDANKLKKRVNDDPMLPPNAQPITKIEIVMSKDMAARVTP